jgi:DNA-binding NtrC family response regulator
MDLLFVDDDAEFRASTVRRFLRRGFHVEEAADGAEGLALAEKRHFDVAVIDMVMPGLSGLELLDKLKAATPECEVILLSGQGTIELAVGAMKRGAHDFLTKPVRLDELEVLIQKAVDTSRLRHENRQLRAVLARSQPRGEIVGESPPMRELLRLIERAGPTDKAILIEGETGTGKELVARALHRASPLADKPLVTINCAALPETLLESELFGHEKGAFTGAVAAKPGLFEIADGGTLLIDEVGELAGSLQAKLLRVLEDGSMRRIGSVKERRVRVRLLAATNRSLADEVKAGRFREDLYYRINVMSLVLPPLRARDGDIPLLIERFLGPDWRIDEAALEALVRYDWPGNVRQLINAIERAKIMAEGGTIRRQDLPREIVQHVAAPVPASVPAARRMDGSDANLALLEKSHIVDVLARERGNKARAARALGVNRRTLYRLLEKYEIDT